jgi:hypothetical protein
MLGAHVLVHLREVPVAAGTHPVRDAMPVAQQVHPYLLGFAHRSTELVTRSGRRGFRSCEFLLCVLLGGVVLLVPVRAVEQFAVPSSLTVQV